MLKVLKFNERFSDQVRTGEKTSTIRPHGNYQPCDLLKLVSVNGDGQSELLGYGHVYSCQHIFITDKKALFISDDLVEPEERLTIALLDGFGSYNEFVEFFDRLYGLPFSGCLIHWVYDECSTESLD